MTLPANIRVNAAVPFPALVRGAAWITISKAGGIWTVRPDYASLGTLMTPGADATKKVCVFDSVSGQYLLVSLADISALGTTISEPRIITVGNVTVQPTDRLIVLNKSAPAATAIALPPVRSRVPLGLELEFFDWPGNAGDIIVTPDPVLSEQIMGSTTPWKVRSGGLAQTGGSLRLKPSVNLNGWLVR